MRDPVRIGNCSGFYGDRIAAAREMVEGGVGAESIDVLCGDYLLTVIEDADVAVMVGADGSDVTKTLSA